MIHLSLQLITDLLLQSTNSLVCARDLCNVEVCHNDEHEEGGTDPEDPDDAYINPQETVPVLIL